VIGVETDSFSWIVEVPVKIESRILWDVHDDERPRSSNGGVLGRVRHPVSLAWLKWRW
jgi:hypothetical protein